MSESQQIAELSKELMIANEQFKFTEKQSQLTKNQLLKTNVTIDEIKKTKEDTKMYRILGDCKFAAFTSSSCFPFVDSCCVPRREF